MVLLKCIAAVLLVLTLVNHGCLAVSTKPDESRAQAKGQGRISEGGSSISSSQGRISGDGSSISSSQGRISGDGSSFSSSGLAERSGSFKISKLIDVDSGLAEPTFAGLQQQDSDVIQEDSKISGSFKVSKLKDIDSGLAEPTFAQIQQDSDGIQEDSKISGSFKVSKLLDVDSGLAEPTSARIQKEDSDAIPEDSKISGSFKISKLMDVDSQREPTQSGSQPSERGCRSCYLKDRKYEGNLTPQLLESFRNPLLSNSDIAELHKRPTVEPTIAGLQQDSDVIPEDSKISGSFKVSKLMDVDSLKKPTKSGKKARTYGCRSCHL